MPKERLYRVTFDTQRDRQYITWGLFISAHNIPEAKDKAYGMWHSNSNPHYPLRNWRDERPHMYHVDASRMTPEEQDHEPGTFFIIDRKYATWGYKG